jgi:hypothetical protein
VADLQECMRQCSLQKRLVRSFCQACASRLHIPGTPHPMPLPVLKYLAEIPACQLFSPSTSYTNPSSRNKCAVWIRLRMAYREIGSHWAMSPLMPLPLISRMETHPPPRSQTLTTLIVQPHWRPHALHSVFTKYYSQGAAVRIQNRGLLMRRRQDDGHHRVLCSQHQDSAPVGPDWYPAGGCQCPHPRILADP